MEDHQNNTGHYLFFGAITLLGVLCAAFVVFGGPSDSPEKPQVVINLEPETETFPVSNPPDRPVTSRAVDPAKLRSSQGADDGPVASSELAFFLVPQETELAELDSGPSASWRPVNLNLSHIETAKSFELGSDQLINLVLNDEGRARLEQLSSENNLQDQAKRAEMLIALLDGRVISSTTFRRPTDKGNLVLATDLSKPEREEVTARINQLCGSL